MQQTEIKVINIYMGHILNIYNYFIVSSEQYLFNEKNVFLIV